MAGYNQTYYSWIGNGEDNRLFAAMYSTILNGFHNETTGEHSVVLGGTHMYSFDGHCCFGAEGDLHDGAEEVTVTSYGHEAYYNNKMLFSLGNGNANGHKNAFTVLQDGRIGLEGIRYPKAFLHIPATPVDNFYSYIPSIVLEAGKLSDPIVPNAIENDGVSLYYTNALGVRSPIGGNSIPNAPVSDGNNYAIKDGLWNNIQNQLHPEVNTLFNIDPNMWLVRTSGGWGDIRGLYEPNLKIPAANNYVLTSQMDGTRSWVDIQSLSHTHNQYLVDAPTDNGHYCRVNGVWGNIDDLGYLTGTKVDSFNTRTGAVTLEKQDVENVLTGEISSHSHASVPVVESLIPSVIGDNLTYTPDYSNPNCKGHGIIFRAFKPGVAFRHYDPDLPDNYINKIIGAGSFECCMLEPEDNYSPADGMFGAVFGYRNRIDNNCCFIGAGTGNVASNANSATIGGMKLVTSSDYEVVIGTFNKLPDIAPGNTPNEDAFTIGNGEIESLRSNAFQVKKDGRVIASSYVKVGPSEEPASWKNVGAIRYRKEYDNGVHSSYAEMCMEIGKVDIGNNVFIPEYRWVTIVKNVWK